MHTIYTFGYSGQQPDTLRHHVERLGALLIDVRLQAWSRSPQWRPDGLKALVGAANYLHVPELGNPNYRRRGPIQLADPEAALPLVREVLTERPIIMLCGCANLHACHRRAAALFFKRTCGAPVQLTLPHVDPGTREWRALTLTQPWASLVAVGAKRIETRSWPTHYRGPLLIHAAKGLNGLTTRAYRDLCQSAPFADALIAGGHPDPTDLPRGALLASCDLVDVQQIDLFYALPDEHERAFGNYGADRYAWQLANVSRLPDPIPASGAQGLWTWIGALMTEVPR